jgi:hypothetical protein
MTKVKLNKEETKNLLNMISSTDVENATVAFQVLENSDLKDYFGELIVLYKYGKKDHITWEKEAPKAWKKISEHFVDKSAMSSGKCLSIMTEKKASKDSLELYFENFVGDMIGFLDQLGYPAEKFDITIKLKE